MAAASIGALLRRADSRLWWNAQRLASICTVLSITWLGDSCVRSSRSRRLTASRSASASTRSRASRPSVSNIVSQRHESRAGVHRTSTTYRERNHRGNRGRSRRRSRIRGGSARLGNGKHGSHQSRRFARTRPRRFGPVFAAQRISNVRRGRPRQHEIR